VLHVGLAFPTLTPNCHSIVTLTARLLCSRFHDCPLYYGRWNNNTLSPPRGVGLLVVFSVSLRSCGHVEWALLKVAARHARTLCVGQGRTV